MTGTEQSAPPRDASRRVAVQALLRSVLINLVAPSVIYRLAAPHFPAASLAPLALSAVPPVLWLAYGVIRLKAIDILGLFAAENVAVDMLALLLAHTEREALVGRSVQNVVLSAIFLGSLVLARPLVFHMARQLMTGNDPDRREAFAQSAARPGAMNTYRILTLVWALALLVKAAGSYGLASHLDTRGYLLFSPLWDLATDSALVAWSLVYGRARLLPPDAAPAPSPA